METTTINQLVAQVAELHADVRYLQGDLAEIRTRQRERPDEASFRVSNVESSYDDAGLDDINKKIQRLNESFLPIKMWLVTLSVIVAETIFFAIAQSAKWF